MNPILAKPRGKHQTTTTSRKLRLNRCLSFFASCASQWKVVRRMARRHCSGETCRRSPISAYGPGSSRKHPSKKGPKKHTYIGCTHGPYIYISIPDIPSDVSPRLSRNLPWQLMRCHASHRNHYSASSRPVKQQDLDHNLINRNSKHQKKTQKPGVTKGWYLVPK